MFLYEPVITGEMLYIHQPEAKSVDEQYEHLFHTYFQKLHTYAFTIVRQDAVAKDIVQNAFIRLWEKKSSIDFSIAARSYLYTTVYRLALNEIRNRKVREHYVTSLPRSGFQTHTFIAEEKEVRQRIQQAIDTLPPRCREIFCKSRFEHKKYAEIAAELNLSVKTVEVQIGKALKLLRMRLSDVAIVVSFYCNGSLL